MFTLFNLTGEKLLSPNRDDSLLSCSLLLQIASDVSSIKGLPLLDQNDLINCFNFIVEVNVFVIYQKHKTIH